MGGKVNFRAMAFVILNSDVDCKRTISFANSSSESCIRLVLRSGIRSRTERENRIFLTGRVMSLSCSPTGGIIPHVSSRRAVLEGGSNDDTVEMVI